MERNMDPDVLRSIASLVAGDVDAMEWHQRNRIERELLKVLSEHYFECGDAEMRHDQGVAEAAYDYWGVAVALRASLTALGGDSGELAGPDECMLDVLRSHMRYQANHHPGFADELTGKPAQDQCSLHHAPAVVVHWRQRGQGLLGPVLEALAREILDQLPAETI